MNSIKKITSIFVLALFAVSGVFAQQAPQQSAPQATPQQTEISDAEMETFASAFQQVQMINQQAQQQMVSAIQEEGFEVKRFNEMYMQDRNPEKEIEASNEEMEMYQSVSSELGEIQSRAQKKMQEKIKEEGMTVERYQEIAMLLQNDPQLQKELQKFMQDESTQG